jgi:hypothetical protein
VALQGHDSRFVDVATEPLAHFVEMQRNFDVPRNKFGF